MISLGSQSSDSSSRPEVWSGIEPYLTGIGTVEGADPGPTARFAPQMPTQEYMDWNRAVAGGLNFGPTPGITHPGTIPQVSQVQQPEYTALGSPVGQPVRGISFGGGGLLGGIGTTVYGRQFQDPRAGMYVGPPPRTSMYGGGNPYTIGGEEFVPYTPPTPDEVSDREDREAFEREVSRRVYGEPGIPYDVRYPTDQTWYDMQSH